MYTLGQVYLASALTSLHVGVGRSVGVVDLPVAKDAFGIPYIPASSLKGTFKSECIRQVVHDLVGAVDYNGTDTLKKNFKNKLNEKCEWLFGWDLRIRETISPEETFSSPINFTDAPLLFFPVRVEGSNGLEYAYATSETLLRRAISVTNVTNKTPEFLSQLVDAFDESSGGSTVWREVTGDHSEGIETVYVNGVPVRVKHFQVALQDVMPDELSKKLSKNIFILSDESLKQVIERGLERVTRVRLDPIRKVVERGALWTEEYVPQGSVFIFSVIFKPTASGGRIVLPKVAWGEFESLLNHLNYVVQVGGKETIGKGMIKLKEVS